MPRRPLPPRLLRALLLLGLLLLAAISAVQARPFERYDPRTGTMRELTFVNLRQGMKLFREFCRKCHTRGGEAPFLYPESRTMAAWNRIFAERQVDCAKKGVWNELTAEQLDTINDYLYHEAYDAWNPHNPSDWDSWSLYGW
ncbi:MAG: cytochrome c [Desulfobacteraceae bacterium]|nr:cytochrome c [Desulfobacteraceae bacterium]